MGENKGFNDVTEFLTKNPEMIKEAGAKFEHAKKRSIITDLHNAIDRYYHPGIGEDELKTIISNIATKSQGPDLESTIRAMIV